MADDRSPGVRTWIVSLLVLVFPFIFLVAMISLFEHCAEATP